MSPTLRRILLPSTLTLMEEVHRGRGYKRGSWSATARMQAQMSSPTGCLQHTGKGFHHVWGFLTAKSAQVPVLTKNVTLDCGDDRPCQNRTQFFSIPKGQSRQMRIVMHPQPHGASVSSTSAAGATTTRDYLPYSISAAAAAMYISLSTPSIVSSAEPPPPLRCHRCHRISH